MSTLFSPHTWGCFPVAEKVDDLLEVLPTYVGVFLLSIPEEERMVLPTYVGVFLFNFYFLLCP